ncbi:unnamed protein product, partial [Owenia fusiformis]
KYLKNPNNLPIQLLARLTPSDGSGISSLLEQCRAHCTTGPTIFLSPLYPYLRDGDMSNCPKTPLGNVQNISAMILMENGQLMTANTNQEIQKWNLNSGTLQEKTNVAHNVTEFQLAKKETFLILLDENQSGICLDTKTLKKQFELPGNISCCIQTPQINHTYFNSSEHGRKYLLKDKEYRVYVITREGSTVGIHICDFEAKSSKLLYNIGKGLPKGEIKAIVTDDENFIVLSTALTPDEIKGIQKQAKGKAQHSGDRILHAIQLTKSKVELIPCNLAGTKIPVLTTACAPFMLSEVMVAANDEVIMWNIERGYTGVSSFKQPKKIEKKLKKAWSPTCMLKSRDEDVLVMSTKEGYVAAYSCIVNSKVFYMPYKDNGAVNYASYTNEDPANKDQGTGDIMHPDKSYVYHSAKLTCVAIANKSHMMASASIDGALKLWPPKDGTRCCIFTVPGHVTHMQFSRDDKHLVTICKTPEGSSIHIFVPHCEEKPKYQCSDCRKNLCIEKLTPLFNEFKAAGKTVSWSYDRLCIDNGTFSHKTYYKYNIKTDTVCEDKW